ncbi:cilia- and flagella-associated protein 337-like [Rhinophrynus dorsalis]
MLDNTLLAVGQDGLISVWTPDVKLKKSRFILDENKQQNRKVKWISDSTLMPQYNKLIIGTCDREIRLYELSNFEPYCQVVGLESLPLYLGYSPRDTEECIIYFGDEQGCVNIILISHVLETLRNWTKCQVMDDIPSVSIDNVKDLGHVKYIRWKVHNDWVTQIRYIHSIDSIISSSNDDYTALVIGCVEARKDLQKLLKDLMDTSSTRSRRSILAGNVPPKRNINDESMFKVKRGVKTFDFCKESNILVTGGLDRIIRLWNPYVPGWPIGLLRGHSSPITFLRIADENSKIYSVSTDCTVMVWDIEDHSCLINVISKASQIRGEIATCFFSAHLGALYIATDSLSVLQLQENATQTDSDLSAVSHKEPVTCCQYNQSFEQVVTCSEGSVIKTWDLLTGQLVSEVKAAHGSSGVTCLALDFDAPHVFTGVLEGISGCTPPRQYQSHLLQQHVQDCIHALTHHGWILKMDNSDLVPSQRLVFLGFLFDTQWGVVFLADEVAHQIIHKMSTVLAHVPVTAKKLTSLLGKFYHGSGSIRDGSRQGTPEVCDPELQGPTGPSEDDEQDEVLSENQYLNPSWTNNMLHVNDISSILQRNGHKGEIVCVASLPPDLVATSTIDGEVIVWDMISGNIFCRLTTPVSEELDNGTDDLIIQKILCICSRIEWKRESAVLVASGPRGQITFWNICGGGKVFGSFAGSHYQSVVKDMAVSEDDSILCAADQLFYVYIWNISHYALHGPEEKPPTLLHCWRAHLCEITRVVPVIKQRLVVTSSLDCTVKLWSLEGEHIGTFGQSKLWDLKERPSWKEQSSDKVVNTETLPSHHVSGSSHSQSSEEEQGNRNIIPEFVGTSLPVGDKDIAEELRKRNMMNLESRVKTIGSKPVELQQTYGRLNAYQSLQICDLMSVSCTVRKPNPAAELNDPYDLAF